MDGKKQFEITEKAGAFVAGQRNPGANSKIWLTDEQAFYPLIAGEIAPHAGHAERAKPAKKPAAPKDPEA